MDGYSSRIQNSPRLGSKLQLRVGGKDFDGQVSRLQFSEPKSRRSRRTISLPDFVVDALRGQRARQAEARLKAGSDWEDQDLVFTTHKGTPFEPRRFDTEFKRVLTNAKLPRTIRLHDSRHFALTLLAAQGVHPRTAMEIVGHSDINLTMNIYSHVVPELMRDAAQRINTVLAV